VGSTDISQCVCAGSIPSEAFPFGYYGRAGEECYYCQNDRAWTCTVGRCRSKP
jgi:hypothetical protein